jgi:hypothetical protein
MIFWMDFAMRGWLVGQAGFYLGIFYDFLDGFCDAWLAGGAGGFLFGDFVLRTRFWINPPLRVRYQFYC